MASGTTQPPVRGSGGQELHRKAIRPRRHSAKVAETVKHACHPGGPRPIDVPSGRTTGPSLSCSECAQAPSAEVPGFLQALGPGSAQQAMYSSCACIRPTPLVVDRIVRRSSMKNQQSG